MRSPNGNRSIIAYDRCVTTDRPDPCKYFKDTQRARHHRRVIAVDQLKRSQIAVSSTAPNVGMT
jgi:hypothetical protein